MIRCTFVVSLMLLSAACTTPYHPAVITKRSVDFPGISGLMGDGRTVDVVMIHGMCTHTVKEANEAMDAIVVALDKNMKPLQLASPKSEAASRPIVEVVERTDEVIGSKVHFSAIIWSGLTTPLKQQLLFDQTGMPNDCRTADAASCKPIRAKLNGYFKGGLLDDCLADALIYQGQSQSSIKKAIVQAMVQIIAKGSDTDRPLVLVSASLGSKIIFDALSDMLTAAGRSDEKVAGRNLSERLALVYMEANQMPILGLADQDIGAYLSPPAGSNAKAQDTGQKDSLQAFLRQRQRLDAKDAFGELKIVAFSDPNDLLSYRLLSSRYASEKNIAFADVLVSNDSSYFGLFENPWSAHTAYGQNPDVARFIACGNPISSRCK